MKIGVIAESFLKPLKECVNIASSIGADGMQVYAGQAFLLSDSRARLKELKNMLNSEGLVFSAICGDIGCSLYYEQDREGIDKEKRIMEQAKELGTDIVTTHIGVVPEEKNCWQYESMFEVCRELSEFAGEIDGRFAVETGPEKASVLKGFLEDIGGKSIAVNLDPANLVMCAGDDPVAAVYTLKDYIVHTHAKDGVQLKKFDTRALYAPKYFDMEGCGWGVIEERPLGKGGVDWDRYIGALKEIGYDGFLTIERECGSNPEKDIKEAVQFLDKYKVREKR